MSFWKVVGGIAAGVGAVAALPVAGPIGAVTAVGAVVGGVVGGTAGAAVALNDEDEIEQRDKEIKKGRAENIELKDKYEKELQDLAKKLEGYKEHTGAIVGMVAIGMATANADGEIAPSEKEAIMEFSAGVQHSKLPSEVQSLVKKLIDSPPSLQTAISIIKEHDKNPDWSIYRGIITVVIHADEKEDDLEKEFLNNFDILAA